MSDTKLKQLNRYYEFCEQALWKSFDYTDSALRSKYNWIIPNRWRKRRILRRSLKMQGEEKDAFDLRDAWITLDYFVWSVMFGSIKQLTLRSKLNRLELA
jgi:hypothetical protein